MKFGALIAALFLLFSTCAIVAPDYADAARMGGGRSFGSKPFMNKPAPAPRQATPRQQAGTPAAPASSKAGMLGGLAGGLLAGTLLGSLLGGNGFGGGGFMDLIILAILAYVAYKLFQRFRSRQAPQPAGGMNRGMFGQQPPFGQPLQRDGGQAWGGAGFTQGDSFQAQPNVDIPADFNVDEFLRGAKMAYNRLQKSWDKRDLNDIANFATPVVMAQLKQDLAADPNPGNTEILMLNAQLLGVEDDGSSQRAQVYFDALLRENPNQATPENAREVWHFLREGKNGMWKLDGIQQTD